MQHLFKRATTTGNGRVFNKYRYVQRGLSDNLSKVLNYVRANSVGIDSEHPLIKLIHALNISLTLDSNLYYNKISNIALDISNSLGFTSEIDNGKIFPGTLLGKGIREVYLSAPISTPVFDVNGRLKNWRRTETVKILYNVTSDLNFDIPQGLTNHDLEGYAVIQIDIPMFALQIREWKLLELEKPVEVRESLPQFLYKYPLANMLTSQLNVNLFNKLSNMNVSSPDVDSTARSVVPIINYDKATSDAHEDILDFIYTDRASFDTILDNVPLTDGYTLRDILPNVDIVNTRQVYWAVVLSYLPYIEFLMSTYLINQHGTDNRTAKLLKTEIRRIRNDKSYKVAPDKELSDMIETRLSNLYDLI